MDWKATIGSIAPALAGTIGTLVGTPAVGTLAYGAISKLCSACGLEPSPANAETVAQMAADGKLTGDQMIALKQADNAHIEAMQKQADAAEQAKASNLVAEDRIQADDTASARARQVSVRDATPQILTYMALSACVLLSASLVGMSLKGVHPDATLSDTLKSMVELMKNLCVMGFGFFLAGGQHLGNTMDKLYNSVPSDRK